MMLCDLEISNNRENPKFLVRFPLPYGGGSHIVSHDDEL